MMNMRTLIFTFLFVSCQLALTSLHALTVELYNIRNDQPNSNINFGMISNKKDRLTAKQYHKISYPEIAGNKEIRIYTDNTSWKGSSQEERSGLISVSTLKDRAPLYWIDFSSSQSSSIQFSEGTESSWKLMTDRNNPDFDQKKSSTLLTLQTGGVSYLYLGAKVEANAAGGDYKTKIVFEVANLNADLKAPMISEIPSKSQFFLSEAIAFKTLMEDDFQVKSAALFFRYQGETSYSSMTMTLNQNIQNPFQYLAQASFALGVIKVGILEYYIEANDGSNRSFLGSAASPKQIKIVDDFDEISEDVSSGGGKFKVFQGDSASGATELIFPAGSVDNGTKISAKKIRSQTISLMNGQMPVAAFEFGPKGLKFNRPITLQVSYSDKNQDGIVDDTDLKEKDLKLFWYDGFAWRNVGGEVDEQANTVKGNISHFSIYGIFSGAKLSESEIRPKEKIITPNGDGVNDFAQFGVSSGDYDVNIFNVQGKRIRRLEKVNIWDGRSDDGEIVESGVYIYKVHTGENDVSGTIGVAR